MRRHRWIALAAVLLAATALLLSLGEEAPPPAARRQVEYPRWFDGPDHRRQQARATLALPRPAGGRPPAAGPEEPGEPEGLRDPFLVSLPVKEGGMVMVFEANALRHSRLGERFIACLEARRPGDLAELEREFGVDPLKDLDRVAFLDDAVVLSGHFQHLKWDRLASARHSTYGRDGRVYRDGAEWIAAWRDQLIVVSSSEEGVHRAIDQLEGRAPIPPSGIDENSTYGEVYGVIPGAAARRLLGGDERGIGSKLASLASRIELHVDAMQDVAAVVRVQGTDAGGLEDLAKTIGGALAVARVKAQAEGDREFADLLEHAQVEHGGASFDLQLAIPADRLERWFADCERPRPPPSEAPADP
ncbi:MAG TPA: hypothetical protein VEB43_16635 [Anaeromyxobacter sp.]|nr:hypothetical protein [Anaeromyxobacter sp.]